MAKVSVPEKTLEHWSSLYLAYRYQSKASMWWPSTGADIDVRWLPARPGKAVQLELKTTVVAGAHYHDVMLNLGQLWGYSHRPLARQPFYVLPWPDWSGDLESVAIGNGVPPTEIAFSRSTDTWWFAEWMVVLTTAQVASVLRAELAAHGSASRRGASCRLVRFDMTSVPGRPIRTWGSHAKEPTCVPWRQFWTELQTCGRDGWPQLIRVPAAVVHQDSFTRAEVAALLSRAADLFRQGERQDLELVTLAPSDDAPGDSPDVFEVVEDPVGDVPEDVTEDEQEPDHRQVVFVEAGARARRG
jgi:hypothetical protein